MEFLTKLLESETSPQVQAVLVTGLAKLSLSGMVTDDNVRRKAKMSAGKKPTAHHFSGHQEFNHRLRES